MKNYDNIVADFEFLVEMMENSARQTEFRKLIKALDSNFGEGNGYFHAPASAKYHLSTDGGLLAHSVSVAKTMLIFKDTIAKDLPIDSCIIAGLLHDVGKLGYVNNPFYVPNEKFKSRDHEYRICATPYNYNNTIMHMQHAHRSLYLVQQFGFTLTDEEYQAILIHDGMYVEDNKNYALKECKLAVVLHMADLWSCKYLESETDLI